MHHDNYYGKKLGSLDLCVIVADCEGETTCLVVRTLASHSPLWGRRGASYKAPQSPLPLYPASAGPKATPHFYYPRNVRVPVQIGLPPNRPPLNLWPHKECLAKKVCS